ncbi:hypothetical protein [Deinococcus humi]|uniref:Uncharacterized protein n=1 Tax=Deinococcus humi TaxID=662880 RepID=A0A7W8JZK7_9DEIO|nr:hypothetical protein [Deinococcus humi]MBB5366126.1 hypothetical protein [Deinococcus humi]GGO40207.1 hypothetical protein GCM10008949_49430 [Deinococcus humi]
MSTTFDVYPGSVEVPFTREVLALGASKLWAYLTSIGIDEHPQVHVKLLARGNHQKKGLILDAPFAWPEDQYMWFTVGDGQGGTDAYCECLEVDEGFDFSTHGLPFSQVQMDDLALFETARIGGRWWYFRRSAGQPALVNVLYGCLASALAALTHGVVYSSDSAWDYTRFPAQSAEFDRWFMRPEHALGADFREWAQRIQEALIRELQR